MKFLVPYILASLLDNLCKFSSFEEMALEGLQLSWVA